jgi:hypothetical protein
MKERADAAAKAKAEAAEQGTMADGELPRTGKIHGTLPLYNHVLT